jgi:hypothetical protein
MGQLYRGERVKLGAKRKRRRGQCLYVCFLTFLVDFICFSSPSPPSNDKRLGKRYRFLEVLCTITRYKSNNDEKTIRLIMGTTGGQLGS